MTYTFETSWDNKVGSYAARVKITAPTEDIAWEQLRVKVEDDFVLWAQLQEKNFRLVGKE